MKHRAFSIITYFISFFILIFLFFFFDVSKALIVIGSADLIIVLYAFLLSGFVLFLKAYRWHTLLLNSGYKVRASYSCVSMFLGLFVSTLTPGRVGEPVRSYFLKKMSSDRMSGTVPLVVIERAADIILLVVVSIAGTLAFISESDTARLHLFEIFLIVLFVAFCIVFTLLNKKFIFFIIKKANNLFSRKINPNLFYSAISKTKTKGFPGKLMLATAVIWFFEGLALYISLLSVGLFLSPLICFILVSISFLIGAVTFLPGGLGSLDAALIFMISSFGLEINALIAGVIIYRALSYVALGILSAGSMPFLDKWSASKKQTIQS